MKILICLLTTLLSFSAIAEATQTKVITIESKHSAEDTFNKLVKIVKSKGLTIFNEVKHSTSAAKVDIELRDTFLLIFGNPKIGSQFMKCNQKIGIDLPLKALVYKDENNKVWVDYSNPKYFQTHYGLGTCAEKFIKKASGALKAITKMATK